MHSKLQKHIFTEDILLNYSKLNDNILGFYHSIDGLDLIIINESIIFNTKLLNCVIAEELGHYFTTKGNSGPYSSNELSDTINYDRVEVRALKWAVNFLIPTNELLKFLSKNDEVNIYDLSDKFEVTNDFIMRKLYYLSLVKSRFQLTMNKYLVLSSYPSVFIYSDYERRTSDGQHSKTS